MRPLNAGDDSELNFVRKSWAKEMRRAAWTCHVAGPVYWPCQQELIARVMRDSVTMLACDPEDPGHIYGCIVVGWGDAQGTPIVHWLYVAGDFRGMGVARHLIEMTVGSHRPILCTQATEVLNDRALVDRYDILYCPYILLGISLEQVEERPCPPPHETRIPA